jgi:hypothetical protein
VSLHGPPPPLVSPRCTSRVHSEAILETMPDQVGKGGSVYLQAVAGVKKRLSPYAMSSDAGRGRSRHEMAQLRGACREEAKALGRQRMRAAEVLGHEGRHIAKLTPRFPHLRPIEPGTGAKARTGRETREQCLKLRGDVALCTHAKAEAFGHAADRHGALTGSIR